MIEYNQEYNSKLRKLCEDNPTSYGNVLRSRNGAYLLKYIMDCTRDFLGDDTSILGKRINFILHEFQDFPTCKNPECNNKVKGCRTLKWNSEWTEHCCNKCAQNDPEIQKRVKQRKKEKYGDENYNGNVEEIKARNRERYGSDWFFGSEEGKRKAKEGYLKKGYDHPMHCQEIKDGMSERYMKEHGVPYSCLDPEVMKKAKSPYFYNGFYFKSSWELAYYMYLDDKGISFEYQPKDHFSYIDNNGKTRYYFPDFKVGDGFVEIKGDQFVKDDGEYKNPYDTEHKTDGIYEAKHRCMMENDIKILSRDELKDIFEYCRDKFDKDSKWYLKFKVNERPKNSILDIKDLEIDFDPGNLMKEFEYFKNKSVHGDKVGGYCSQNAIVKYFQQDVFFKEEKEIWKTMNIRETN